MNGVREVMKLCRSGVLLAPWGVAEEPVVTLPPVPVAWRAAVEQLQAPALMRHVEALAADAMEGRHYRSEGGRKAARYLAAAFEEAGLQRAPKFAGFEQALPDQEVAPNLIGVFPGSADPYYYLITAHYDHLRPRAVNSPAEDGIFNGADDNASGVAGLVEMASALRRLPEPTRASIAFVAFTGEEAGLVGARYFVSHPPFPLDRIRGVINLDMISRGSERLLFAEGGKKSPRLYVAATRARRHLDLELRFDQHPEWVRQGDHYVFMTRGIPTLYFGVEEHEDYHQVSDSADKVLPGLIERTAKLALLTILYADSEEP